MNLLIISLKIEFKDLHAKLTFYYKSVYFYNINSVTKQNVTEK